MVFNQSMRGLVEGAPIDLLGVEVGIVRSVSLLADPATRTLPVEVAGRHLPAAPRRDARALSRARARPQRSHAAQSPGRTWPACAGAHRQPAHRAAVHRAGVHAQAEQGIVRHERGRADRAHRAGRAGRRAAADCRDRGAAVARALRRDRQRLAERAEGGEARPPRPCRPTLASADSSHQAAHTRGAGRDRRHAPGAGHRQPDVGQRAGDIAQRRSQPDRFAGAAATQCRAGAGRTAARRAIAACVGRLPATASRDAVARQARRLAGDRPETRNDTGSGPSCSRRQRRCCWSPSRAAARRRRRTITACSRRQ